MYTDNDNELRPRRTHFRYDVYFQNIIFPTLPRFAFSMDQNKRNFSSVFFFPFLQNIITYTRGALDYVTLFLLRTLTNPRHKLIANFLSYLHNNCARAAVTHTHTHATKTISRSNNFHYFRRLNEDVRLLVLHIAIALRTDFIIRFSIRNFFRNTLIRFRFSLFLGTEGP